MESEEEELGEDSVLLESPLDKLDTYQLFRSALVGKYSPKPRCERVNLTSILSLVDMQQEQPQFYASLAAHLSAEEQAIIQNAFQQAESNARAMQFALAQSQADQQANAAAAAASAGGMPPPNASGLNGGAN